MRTRPGADSDPKTAFSRSFGPKKAPDSSPKLLSGPETQTNLKPGGLSLSFSHLRCQVRNHQVLERPQLYDPPVLSRNLAHLPRASRFGLRPTQLRPGAEPRAAIGWSPARRGARIGWVEPPVRCRETPDRPSLSLHPGPFKGFRLARGRGPVSRVEGGEDVRTVSFNSATDLAPKSSALLSAIPLYQNLRIKLKLFTVILQFGFHVTASWRQPLLPSELSIINLFAPHAGSGSSLSPLGFLLQSCGHSGLSLSRTGGVFLTGV
ncbi:uncharacterized protein LOC121103542 [Ursus maritimus]|uniref:Uncharacterized protein LOC121103542 n=1 Tax=Ursus maritimus TaxID=29073 RepID=A0A8M1G3Z4_URSMA|nr:uncharacterized protein LOC121103542 [Ursus maritimus]